MNVDFLNKQCYRIAFIGRTSSGKTCILASLGLGRNAKSRLTSSFRQLDVPKLTNAEKQRLKKDKNIQLRWNFQVGEDRLNEAMKNLKAGKRPDHTERTGKDRPMLEFQLGDSEGRGDFYIWTEDYPGEWINVEELKLQESEAQVLKQSMLHYDGLILVVDTAVTEEQKKDVARDIEKLSGFFTCLAEDMKTAKAQLSQIPIAIVLSKWDRYSKPIQFDAPEEERKKLEEYLQQNPMYESLIKMIRSNAQQQEAEPTGNLMAGIAYGNTAVFPVSSFGKSVDDVEGERPDETNQFSFGIVEPFFWLACRSDDLNIDRLEKTYESTRKWRLGKVAKIKNDAVCHLNRINSSTESKKRYSALIDKCKTVQKHVGLLYGVAVLAFLFFLCDFCLSYRVSRWESIIGAPSTTLEQLVDMRKELDNYKAYYFRGLFFAPSAKQIDGDIKSVDSRIDGLLWNPIENPLELSKKAELAQKYVDLLPNGPHSKDAWKYINDNKISLEEEFWKTVIGASDKSDRAKRAKQYLEKYNGDGAAIHAREADVIIEQYYKSIEEDVWKQVNDAVPDSENQLILAEDYLEKYPNGEHIAEAKEIIDRIRNNRIWDKALSHYNEIKINGSIPQIFNELQELISRFGITQERCLPLVTEVPKLIESKLNTFSVSTSEYEMIKKCDDALESLKSFENVLRGKNENSLADSIVNTHEFVGTFRTGQIDMYDRKQYEKVRNSKTIDMCDNYHNKMEPLGGGAMESCVSDYKKYLESKDTIQNNVLVECSLYWGPQTPVNTKIKSELHISNNPLISDIRSFAADVRPLGSVTLNGINPTEDKISISVKLVSQGNVYNWNNLNYGEGEDSFYLSELMSSTGRSIELRDGRNGKFNARLDVTASAPGMKSEPELPTWTKK